MPQSSFRPSLIAAVIAGAAALAPMTPAQAQSGADSAPAQSQHLAKGRFTVQMKPLSDTGLAGGNAKLGRMSLDKVFEGDLAAVGQGEMLTAMTQTQGSAGYVAIERVTGSLQGRQGSFVLQHSGQMDRGAQSLSIRVVPDSGSGDLIGLQGELKIRIEGGQHFYEFAYTLPDLVR